MLTTLILIQTVGTNQQSADIEHIPVSQFNIIFPSNTLYRNIFPMHRIYYPNEHINIPGILSTSIRQLNK